MKGNCKMTLELHKTDLKIEFENIPASQVTFDKLNDKAQQAVCLVGRGVFYSTEGHSYNAVYPPSPHLEV